MFAAVKQDGRLPNKIARISSSAAMQKK